MTDITTKIILAVIALGVWVNAFMSSERQVAAQQIAQHTDSNVSDIADNISRIADGVCQNHKLC
jgi:hypothetical protein